MEYTVNGCPAISHGVSVCFRRQVAQRGARDLCLKCRWEPSTPERNPRATCGEKRRTAERCRYAAGSVTSRLLDSQPTKDWCRTRSQPSRMHPRAQQLYGPEQERSVTADRT